MYQHEPKTFMLANSTILEGWFGREFVLSILFMVFPGQEKLRALFLSHSFIFHHAIFHDKFAAFQYPVLHFIIYPPGGLGGRAVVPVDSYACFQDLVKP